VLGEGFECVNIREFSLLDLNVRVFILAWQIFDALRV
jgi:hypothetical protein